MDEVFKPKGLLIMAVFSLAIGMLVLMATYGSRNSKIVFCDVGQGDATYIRTASGYDMLIDAGDSRGVLDCLGASMPPFDRHLDIVIVTHPHKDHYGGFVHVLEKYRVGLIVVSPMPSNTQAYQRLIDMIAEKNISLMYAEEGSTLRVGDRVKLEILWPKAGVVASRTYADDPNAYSVVFMYREGTFDALFTGDIGPPIIAKLDTLEDHYTDGLDVLKVPHHGSDDGVTYEFLQKHRPAYSTISVGKTNRYDHPSPKVLDMFKELGLAYDMTSEKGPISLEIHPDGTFSR